VRTLSSLDYAEAKRIVDAVVERALTGNKAAVITVADAHGELLALARMDGALSSIAVATNKAWTAARERKPTQEIGDKVKHPQRGFDVAYYGDPRIVGWGGGVPIWKNGEVVGAVTVSGLSSAEDIVLANFGIALLGDNKEKL